MKFNKYVCHMCSHEFYDSKSSSQCDRCGAFITLPMVSTRVDVKLQELIPPDSTGHLRDAVHKIMEDSRTTARNR